MKTAAIICEYNPLHTGHQYQIAHTKELCGADFIVAIMSGNYVQRGDVSIYSKELRAKAAIACGADLVIELPTVYAMQTAEVFAKSGVEVANSTGIIDFLSFGAENDDIAQLSNIAKVLNDESKEFSEVLKAALANGYSFPSARAEAIRSILGSRAAEVISTPNNILAVEYCKALISTASTITPIAIKRQGVDHDSAYIVDGYSSATNIRRLLLSGDTETAFSFIPQECHQIFESAQLHSTHSMEKSIIAELLKTPAPKLAQISDVGEGMENRIKAAVLEATSLEHLTELIKTKRYTHSRIRRILLSAYLGILHNEGKEPIPYIKILDHNEKGCRLIAKMKKTASLPIVRNTSQVNKLNNPIIKEHWERERMFDKLYEMFI